MLAPKRVKHRKVMKGRRRGYATRGNEVSFGEYGLMATQDGWLTARQIEACRISIMRHVRKFGRMWIRIFPDKPIGKKPAETRMGKGKGAPDTWVCVIKPGRVLFEVGGAPEGVSVEALAGAAHKLPLQCKVIKRGLVLP